ncbi:MAG: hypothetical protein JSW60_02290 [Thermoplasmatales archaeon]|nr:MAG: hypothetical protein JSW60_02290 [Thermoplasmatales archaeon]
MKKLNNILKAVVVIGIALAFVVPGAAMLENKPIAIEKSTNYPTPKISGMNPGWIEQASGFWEPSRGISYMHAVDENVVWAAAYDGYNPTGPCQEFTKTTNGGDLWEADEIFEAPDDGLLAMIFGLDENTAWVPIHSGDPQGIWKTSDGGSTWVHQDTADFNGPGAFPNIVHFWNENDGWCQGDPVDGYYEMYTTTDGGDTWTRVPEENIPEPLSGEMGTVGYYDVVGDTVWFGTQSGGRVFKSTDKGLHWTVADTPLPSGAYVDVRFKDENNGLAMDKNFQEAVLAETSDGGETWTLISQTGMCYGADFDYVPGTDNMYVSTGVGSPYRGVSYSIDGGHSWTDWTEMLGIQLFATTWVEGVIGWAGSFNTDEETGGMYKYTPEEEEPELAIGSITGGKGIKAEIKNNGFADATNVVYDITISGGLIIIPKTDSGDLGTITPGESKEVTMSPIGIGLGIITPIPQITVTAECTEGSSAEKSANARIILFFVQIK